ncbi:hypothetical protein CYMTET_33330 [Cymbomonas tetramitiformis]|uniref:Uncharacterized protein n=1 Tax=Cymbomonas tetramitiformis TaxID=36881 RepID=A0AAE0FD87_9CHLO|nr:hypothetical protein CYMTET_33330 [Cymbomonas tetramitiformis]
MTLVGPLHDDNRAFQIRAQFTKLGSCLRAFLSQDDGRLACISQASPRNVKSKKTKILTEYVEPPEDYVIPRDAVYAPEQQKAFNACVRFESNCNMEDAAKCFGKVVERYGKESMVGFDAYCRQSKQYSDIGWQVRSALPQRHVITVTALIYGG